MRQNRRILQVITLSDWGGAQSVLFDLATRLQEEGMVVEVACSPGGPLVAKLKEQGIKVHLLSHMKRDFSPLSDLKCLIELYRLIRRGKYDIVHCHSTKAGFLGRTAAWLARVKKIYFTVHGWGFYNTEEYGKARGLLVVLERIAARFSTKLICVSKNDMVQGLENRIAPKEKLHVIHNGIKIESFPEKGILRREIGAGEEEIVFGFVGRLAPPKNPQLFLKAAEKVLGIAPNSKFVLIGDGPFYEECLRWVRSQGLTKSIFLLGFRSDVRLLLQDFDVFVLPSRWEGLPLTVIEAMFAGKPVIATDVGGVSELVENGKTGFLIPSENLEELVEKISFFLSHPDEIQKMGFEGKKKAEEAFTLKRMIENYSSIYESP